MQQDRTVDNMGSIYKALADPTRRKILQLLRDGELSAGEIASNFSFAKPTISRHLTVLREADLVQSTKKGTTIIYQLNASVLEDAILSMMDMFKIDVVDVGDHHE